ncbi:MAG: site-2 protease family protein, partial [Chlamydiae bacterium]
PLDGSHILRPLLGYNGRRILDKMSAYSLIILIIFINTPIFDIMIRGVNNLFILIANIII